MRSSLRTQLKPDPVWCSQPIRRTCGDSRPTSPASPWSVPDATLVGGVVVETGGEDTIAIHPMMHLALSYDHRIIDGATGNGFLFRVGKYLQAAEFEL